MTTQEQPQSVHFGLLVHVLRLFRGWSVDELATRSGVSRGLIWSLEQGDAGPFTRTMARLLWERMRPVLEGTSS